ncbi:MAG: S16 family serine protease [Microbacteriaceae bacterium]
MSLFTGATGPDPSRETPPRPGDRRSQAGWGFLTVAFAIVLILGLSPAPYVIEKPGPVFNTLGSSSHDGKRTALISIPDKTTYPTAGTLDLLTVSALGNPSSLPSWVEVLAAWFQPQQAVIPVDVAYPPSQSVEQQQKVDAAEMTNSQQDAIAAALNHLHYDFPQSVEVKQVAKGVPATGKLQTGDRIVSVDTVPVNGIQSLRDAIAKHGTATPADIGVVRDGTALTLQITPVSDGGAVVLGIGVGMDYSFPFTVKIQLDDVGGPSAGMMFALGIMDKLTPGELNGGRNVAGTGTIDSEGNVGAIGGIRQKMWAAHDANARYFLAPAQNCGEVTGHIPQGLRVFAVKKLDDSLKILSAIRSGSSLSTLPRCPTD